MMRILAPCLGLMVGCLGLDRPAIAAKVTLADMPAHCQGEAVKQFNLTLPWLNNDSIYS